jgi:hypothetical protein
MGKPLHFFAATAVRNMRRDGVPQLVRMKISGHNTDSMKRRYNIVDADDMNMAKSLMGKRMRVSETVVETVVVLRKPEKPGDTQPNVESAI